MGDESVKPGQRRPARLLRVLGDVIRVRVSSRDTEGRMALCEVSTPPHAGPPTQVHRYEDECFYILDGQFAFEVGGLSIDAGPGDWVFVPRETPYRYRNTGESPGRLLLIAAPGGLDRFFEEMSSARAEDRLSVLEKHGLTLLPASPGE
jgi:mannose-6-phosphate isomerase-like protein (cupin superfamily)